VWEKLAAGIRAFHSATPEQAAALETALDHGRQAYQSAPGEDVPKVVAAAFTPEDRAVAERARELVGLDACELAITGAAPVPLDVVDFYLSLGMPLSEIYGLSETCGPHTWEPYRVRPGTVGPPMPGCEVRIADDGEVLLRGGNVFTGYLGEPERTEESFDESGWFLTGDIGRLDDGYLRIVDRKKELIITAGGKNISPAHIEAELKTIPLVSQVLVVGEARPYLVALLVLDSEVAPIWARQHDIGDQSLIDLAAHPQVRNEISRGVEEVNRTLARPEQIKRFAVFGREWLPAGDELTPTMKLKRRSVQEKYASEIETLYTP
jgi:long-chain acyl-CoA synthetase